MPRRQVNSFDGGGAFVVPRVRARRAVGWMCRASEGADSGPVQAGAASEGLPGTMQGFPQAFLPLRNATYHS